MDADNPWGQQAERGQGPTAGEPGAPGALTPQRFPIDGHLTAIGVLLIAWGALVILAGIIVLAAAIFGGAVGASQSGEDKVFGIAAGAGTLVAMILVVVALPAIVAGIGVLQRKPWARIMAMVMAGLALLSIPLGTAFGIYALIILSKPEAEEAMRQPAL